MGSSNNHGFDAVTRYPPVGGQEDQPLLYRLRHQHPVEGIVVVAGKGANDRDAEAMLSGERGVTLSFSRNRRRPASRP